MSEAPADAQNIRQEFIDYLSSAGFRITKQRIVVLEAALDLPEHFTAEDLLESARRRDRSLSRATIYRALPVMVESGTIREVDVGRDHKFFRVNRRSSQFQAQVICSDCSKIFDIDAPFMEWYGDTVASKLQLTVQDQRLQVTASCDRLKSGNCQWNRADGGSSRTL